MVHLAPRYSRPMGMGFYFLFYPRTKDLLFIFHGHFIFMSMWSFFEIGRRIRGYPGGRGLTDKNPLLLKSRLPSLPFLFRSSSSLTRILDHGLWGRSVFSLSSSLFPCRLSCIQSNKDTKYTIFFLIYLHPVLSYTGVRWRHQYIGAP